MSSSDIKKNNINELSLIFKEKILLNPYRVEDLKKFAIEAKLTKENLRPMAWKIFLGVLPETTSLREWVEIISNQREEYKKKLKKFCKIKKFVGDPLGGNKKGRDLSLTNNIRNNNHMNQDLNLLNMKPLVLNTDKFIYK